MTEDLPLEGLPLVTCPCSPAQVCVWAVELGPHQVLDPVSLPTSLAGLSQRGLKVQPHGGTRGSCHGAHTITDRETRWC